MAEALLNTTSLLCSGLWTWNPDEKCTIEFDADGTGALYCGVEFNIFIACRFDWEMRSWPDVHVMNLPALFDIAITLTKRPLKKNAPKIMPTSLGEAAFKQKSYRLRLERGNFKVKHRTTYGFNPTYEYRLMWDKAPYPPLEEWNCKPAARAGRYWERRDFYRGQIEGAE